MSDQLMHYGVKGMRKGARKSREQRNAERRAKYEAKLKSKYGDHDIVGITRRGITSEWVIRS